MLAAIKSLKDRGARARLVTNINKENISFCREMLKFAEVFHKDNVKGIFQLIDGKDYLCYIVDSNEGKIAFGEKQEQRYQLFHTSNKSFVAIQQYLFDNLCDRAITAREKIKEIKRGIRKNDFVDTVNDPAEIIKIVSNQLLSAKEEILLFFSTSNSFYRAKSSGMLTLLRHVPNDVTVKVLVQAAHHIKEVAQKELRNNGRNILIQYITKPVQRKIVTIVVDQATSIAIEIKDDTKKTFEEASGAAIYSNRELTVSSCISIFETLWIQSELEKQNKIKQAYFQMFKGLELRKETYSRRSF